jgi:hypothetical protein
MQIGRGDISPRAKTKIHVNYSVAASWYPENF